MGQYLDCGIATEIIVEKRRNSTEKILEKIKNKIDLNIYNISQNDELVCLDIKEDVFEKYAIPFIEEQLEMVKSNLTTEKELKSLKNLEELKGKSYEELIKISNEKSNYFFQRLEGNRFCNDVSYLTDGDIAYADVISYISDGKIYMECYHDIFDYIRKLIIKSSKNPIRTAAVVTIIG